MTDHTTYTGQTAPDETDGEAELSVAGEAETDAVAANEAGTTAAEPEATADTDPGATTATTTATETETDSDAATATEAEAELEGAEDVEEAEDAEDAPPESPYDRPGQWFVIHSYAGYENKVKSNLESRIASMNMEERIFEVVIPMEDVPEFKNGKQQIVSKKLFPGYLMVRMDLDDDSWYVVRNTPGVTGFVGLGARPSPLSRKEVESILQVVPEAGEGGGTRKGRARAAVWEIGETVRVKDGPFADFTGAVAEVNEDKLQLRVLVNIFGRETPVTLDFAQVAKL
jgi:transcriptional antiterminator NusG